MESSSKKLNIIFICSNTPTFDIYIQKTLNEDLKEVYSLPCSLQSLFTIAKIQQHHKCPLTDECMGKEMWNLHAMEYYSAFKK